MRRQMIGGLALTVFMLTMASAVYLFSAQPSSDFHQQVTVMKGLASMPLTFTENRGQWDERALFRTDTGRATMWFTTEGVYFQFVRRVPESTSDIKPSEAYRDDPIHSHPDRFGHESIDLEQLVIKVTFVGANPNPRVVGEEMTEYKCNYLSGDDPDKWHTNVPNYHVIAFEDVYTGIDLEYYSNGQLMEYDFVVSPGADFTQITVKYEGIKSLSVNEAGELLVETGWGVVKELTPLVYQNIDGHERKIACAYHLRSGNSFGYALGEDYDHNLPLVIDPVLAFGTYLGGGGDEECYSIAADGSGSVYVTGYTTSNFDFPTQDPYQLFQGQEDAFVTKVSPAQRRLIYSTYLGGAADERGYSIAVDDSGHAYVTGSTASPDFPTVNPYMTDPDVCLSDAFITKLNPEGNGLVYSTYLGGADHHDWGYGIAVDGSGSAYVAGYTNSSEFPVENPYQTDLHGTGDAFVTKLNTAGNGLVYSTYLGGDTLDFGYAIALDESGCAYITGGTVSSNFPTENPYQTDQGERDGFVTKLNAAGDGLVYSTYLGGNGGDDRGEAIVVDHSGCAYVTGNAGSYDFPTHNPYQTNQGVTDAFVTKLNPAGDGLVYSTYLGGNSWDKGYAIAVDDSGSAYVTGYTRSSDFPTEDPFQAALDTTDAFVTKLNPDGNGLVYSTFLGGSGVEEGRGIAIDDICNLYVTGFTQSTDFPTVKPYQTDRGNTDAFVTRIVGGCYYSSVDDEQNSPVTAHVTLYQNIPNPFNPVTTIRFNLPRASGVTLIVYNVKGGRVRVLANGEMQAGRREIIWDGRDERGNTVSSGIYFYRLVTPEYSMARKMILLR